MVTKNNIFLNANDVFYLLEGDIEKKLLKWDGSDIESFADSLNDDDFNEMQAWSENHAFGSVDVCAAFPNVIWYNPHTFPMQVKKYIIRTFINDCFMMVVQGQTCFKVIEQKELVSHFYKLWNAVNGGY